MGVDWLEALLQWGELPHALLLLQAHKCYSCIWFPNCYMLTDKPGYLHSPWSCWPEFRLILSRGLLLPHCSVDIQKLGWWIYMCMVVNWLVWAIELQEMQELLFLDREGGGYFNTPREDPSVLLCVKEDHDGAEPSGNSVISAINLIRLASMVAEPKTCCMCYRESKWFWLVK